MFRFLFLLLCLQVAVSISFCASFEEEELRSLFKMAFQKVVGKENESLHNLGLSVRLDTSKSVAGSVPLTIEKLSGIRLHSNANVPQKIVMVATTYTLDEIHAFLDVLSQINDQRKSRGQKEIKLHLMVSEEDVLSELRFPRKQFDELVEVNQQALCNDIWTQDFGEFATFYLKNGPPKVGLIDTKKSGDLAFFTGALASMWSWERVVPPGLIDDDQGNFGGNIEVTPDNVLVIGSTASDEMRTTLSVLGYRSNVAVIDTGWLEVGHVDEVISFLPKPDTKLGYVAVVASPMLGLELLRSIPEESIKEKLADFIQSAYTYYPLYPESFDGEDTEKLEELIVKIGQLYAHLKGRATDGAESMSSLVKFNFEAANNINGAVDEFKERLRIVRGSKAELEVIYVPALFEPNDENLGIALIPSMVNHVVLNDQILLPHPFLDIYRQCTSARLWSLGYVLYFVPSLTYHFLLGQLHCGSNVIRNPNEYVHPRYSPIRQLKP